MIIEQNGSQCRGINTEYLIVRNLRGKLRIQGVNTLNHQHLVALKLQLLATTFAASLLEVITRQLYLFTSKQGCELLIKQRQIQGVQMLEIVVTLLIARRLVTIQEIIIERDINWLDTINGQLYA